MKIIHLSFYINRGGAAISARRLSSKLNEIDGITSIFYYISGNETNNIYELKIFKGIYSLYFKFRHHIFTSIFKGINANKISINSLNILPSPIVDIVNKEKPDIVHIHWFQNEMLPLYDLDRFNSKIVFTIHDSWLFSSTEHHVSKADHRYINGYEHKTNDESFLYFSIKKLIFNKKRSLLKNSSFGVISPSRWIYCRAKKSILLKNKYNATIPNLISDIFYTKEKKDNNNKKVILFGSSGAESDHNKGYDLFINSINKIKNKNLYEIWLFGEKVFKNLPKDFSVKQFGKINNEIALKNLYVKANIFVCASREENLPTVIIEAMSCGTPIVAFDVGGVSDLVTPQTGRLIHPYDTEEMAIAIQNLCSNSEKYFYSCLEHYHKNYSSEYIINQHIKFYEDILNEKK